MSKAGKFIVEEYNFSELKKDKSITTSRGVIKGDAQKFNLKSFDGYEKKIVQDLQKTIKEERTFARNNLFKVSSVVSEQRGLKQQEEMEIENRIQNEVNKRLQVVIEEGYQKGYEQGQSFGFSKVQQDLEEEVVERLKKIEELVAEALSFKEEIYKRQKIQMYEMLKMLVKWIALKEIKDDKNYIGRLLEKIIYELQSKTNLLIKLNPNRFNEFPETLKVIEERMGKLSNLRIEVDSDLDENGIIIESDNGIINASQKSQFETLDELFKTLEIYED